MRIRVRARVGLGLALVWRTPRPARKNDHDTRILLRSRFTGVHLVER